MEVVNSFNGELNSLMDCKPPVSKAKMTSVTKAAIKAVKFYKHVVQGVEKFIQKCKPEFKVPGLYVIDSIVRQSRHQFGADKDVFTTRFSRNFDITFQNLFKCPPEEKSKIVRVLNLWQKNNVFAAEVIQPLLDMANPNHAINLQSAATTADDEQEELPPTKQQETSSGGWLGWSADGNSGETDGDLALKAVTQLLQQTQEASVASLLQASGQQLSQSLAENSLMLQLQQLSNALTQQSTTSIHYKPAEQEGTVKFNKKLLDFDYSDEDDDDDKKDDEVPHQQTQENSLAVSMAQNLLSNPDLLRQLQQMQQTIQQTEVLKTELDLQEHLSKQRIWQADELATQSLASGIPSQTTVTYQTTQPLQQTMTTTMTTLQPPPPFDLGSFPSILAPPPQLSGLSLSALGGAIGMSPSMPSMAPPSFLPMPPLTMDSPPINVSVPSMPTIDSPVVVPIEPLPPVETYPVIDLDDSSLPENEDREDSEVEQEKHNEREVDRKSPPRRKERSRSRSRSKKRTLRRSRSRSPKRLRRSSRSRSGSRTRNRHKRDRRSRSKEREREREREKEKEKEKEREKERKKRGLPPFKKDHLGVCSTTLWLGHVSKLVSEEDLADAFGEFGDIVQIDLIPPRGCAFVLMNRRQDAYRALQKLKNIKLQGKSITMAWAPGKGVKGKIYKDYWDAELGVSYIPYEKLPEEVDLDALEEGGMVDEETMPASLKEKQKTGKATGAKVASLKDDKQNSGGEALSKQLSVTDKSGVATEKKFSAIEAAVAAQTQSVVPSPIIPPMMPPQFSMPTMVPGMMPLGCPPPIMPIMSSVNQQSMMPVMGGMPPPYAIPPVATVTPTPVTTETSQIIEKVSEGTPMEELLPESPVVTSADFLTSIDVRVRPPSLDSPAVVSTPSAIETIVGGSCSIPLPPGSAPSMCVSTVTSSSTLVAPPIMTSAVNVMPTSHTGMTMPPFQQFMPPPHMFRPPGFPMMPPMGMNMTHMPPPPVMPGGPVMSNVPLPPPPPPPTQSMMNASNMIMPGGPRMNNMPPMQPPPPPPTGMLPNIRPGMQGMRPPMRPPMPPTFNPDSSRMGPGIAPSWPNSGQSGQSINLQQKHNTTDVDMRGAPRMGGAFNLRPMMSNNVPFRNADMQMNVRMRAPSPSMNPMGRQQQQHQHQQPDSGPPSSVSRTSANTEALGTPLSRNISGERQSDMDRQSTPIEARLSRIAEMSNLDSSPQRPPRGLGDRDGPIMRPGNMIPGEGGLQQPGSIIGRFPGPRMDGPSHRMPVPTPAAAASQRMIRPNLGAPGFNRFPGLHKEVGPVFPGGGGGGPRFPPVAGIPPRGPANFLDDEGGDYDMRFTMRQQQNFGGDRGRFIERDDRRFRPDEQLNNGGDRFEENFMWNRQQPPRLPEGFRERDDRWNRDRSERDFEPDFERDPDRDFRGRFLPDQMRDSRIDERPAWRGMPPQSLPMRDAVDFRRDDDRNRAIRERMNRDRNREFRRDKERSRDRNIVDRSPVRETIANKEGAGLMTEEDASVKSEPVASKLKVEVKAEPSNVKEESADAIMDNAVKSEPIIKTESSEGSADTVQNGIKTESA